MTDQRVEDLRAIADEIEKRGWCRFTLQDDQGRVCWYGAYNYVLHGHHLYAYSRDEHSIRSMRGRRTSAAFADFVDAPDGCPAAWNNEQDEDAEEYVIKTIRACADALEDTRS